MKMKATVHDDLTLDHEPEHNVDYLAHDWKYEDVRATKRHLNKRRTELKNFSRLENAIWRAWFKSRQRAQQIPARYIGWDKDTDTTWLYGPFKSDIQRPSKLACHSIDVSATQRFLLSRLPAGYFQNLRTGILRRCFSDPEILRFKKQRRVHFNEEVRQCQCLEPGNGATISPLAPSSLDRYVPKPYFAASYTLNLDTCFDSDALYDIAFDFDGTPC
ncbi:hypothetical protein BDV59DRAFT_55282 [Aspergillus ambiguus]|uniref:GATA-like domain-containing protein n=1 Tax=Aspergillus ambiguus TaxID=176160 RepID=UPI003CCD9F6D